MLDNKVVSRRRFLCQLTMAGAAMAATPVLISGLPVQAADSSSVPVGKAGDFKTGDYKKVALPDGTGVYVTRDGDDYRALSARCTHRGCEVLWVPGSKQFR